MDENKFKDLQKLLEAYFQHEFDFFRRAHKLVYGNEKYIEDIEPESLFIGVIRCGHPYQVLMDKLEEEISEHIVRVFIMKDEPNRFK